MFARITPVSFFVAFLSTAIALPAFADSAKSLGKSGDWESFTYSDKSGKVCYTASLPKRSLNAPKGRGETYVSITHRPNDKSLDVVSVTAGYTFKKDSAAEIDIGGAKFDLYTTGDGAWARNDKAVVQAMLKGKSLVIHGTPAKGDQTADTYSLDGFAKAYADIGKACGVK
ncbi:MAG: hypothetical protein F8N37_00215 [Telmatospirillum sp.]|nr:hypothetical protein [Telmatospirillum sp.]